MTRDIPIYPVMDSFGCISQFVAIREDILSLREEVPAIDEGGLLNWIPKATGRGGSMFGGFIASCRRILLLQ